VQLISGLRRIKAFKLLGRSEIPARVINLDDIVKGEVSENTQRKDFSWEEIIRIKKAVEPEIKKESEKRMLSGKQNLLTAVAAAVTLKTLPKIIVKTKLARK
jgi:ParB-like chromosome segregation protein Spo0J